MTDISNRIHTWFKVNKRDLPWRNTTDPYKIWLSEIILQQTRVVQGIKYYHRFIDNFPTVQDLAKASEDEVLKLWQGLGYYSRARNLHHTARYISKEYNGVFPSEYKAIRSLKGIGPYTAAAISSIAFNLPHPTVDGNVFRILSRIFGISTPIDTTAGKKEFNELAAALIGNTNPGFHNQALMEFGALQCIPKSPDCISCPLNQLCRAFSKKMVEQLPVKTKKPTQKNRYFYYYYINSGNSTYLIKRKENDIWQNLFQFPLVESEKKQTDVEILRQDIPFIESGPHTISSISDEKKHILSHQIIYARLISIEVEDPMHVSDEFIQINKKDISKFAVSRLMEQFITDLGLY